MALRFLATCTLVAIGANCAQVRADVLQLDRQTVTTGFDEPEDFDYAITSGFATEPPAASEFKPLHRWHLPGQAGTVWLRFQVHYDDKLSKEQTFYAEADERPDQVRLFRVDPGAAQPPKPVASSGAIVPLKDRVPVDRRILLPLVVEPGQTVTYLIAINATVPVGAAFHFHCEAELHGSSHRQDLKLSLYAGFLLALLLINILLFAYTRERLYVLYACVQPWYLIFPAWELGYGLFLGPAVNPWYQFVGMMNGALSVLALGVFGVRFTEVYTYHRRLFWAILVPALLGPVAVIVLRSPSSIPNLLHAITLLLLLVAGVTAIRRGDRSARIWMVGMSLVVISGLLIILNDEGALPFKLTMENMLTLLCTSILLESIAFAVSVSERLNEEAGLLMDKQSSLIRSLEEQRRIAQSANRAHEQFLRHTSDELRTYADLVLDHPTSASQRSITHLDQILQSLVEFSSSSLHDLHVVPETFDICQTVSEVLEILRPDARRRRIDIFNQCEAAGPSLVHADRERVRQILWNLLGNAVRFTANGYIHVGVEGPSGDSKQLRLWVRDNGAGMAPSVQSQLFEGFEPGASESERRAATSSIGHGQGLGLARSRQLARLQGGDLRLAWSRTGAGSQFELFLPIG
jgi:signal transduction histidine kinase